MKKVYFDASVLIAGLLSPFGGSGKLITFVPDGNIIGLTSQTVIEEIMSHQSKIKKTKKEIIEYIQKNKIIIRNEIFFKDIEKILHLMIDLNDAHVFAGALLTKADFMVSLDKKHILHPDVKLKFPGIRICSPKELLSILNKKGLTLTK